MNFKVAKSDLEAALEVVKGGLGSGADLESHVLFRVPLDGDGTRMEVLTHQGRIFSSFPFVATVEQNDDIKMFTVKESRLRMFLDTLPEDAVLVFECTDGKIVDVTGSDVTPSYQSLDPNQFPFWDDLLAVAVKAGAKATLSAERLSKALGYSKLFASKNESRKPELCVCEVKDGVLASTDTKAAALLKVPALEKSTLRMHYKDSGGIQSFLANSKGDIEILEYDRGVFFRRGDGAIFGEGRFLANFPTFSQPDPEDQSWWVIPVKDFLTGLKALRSSAREDDQSLTISRTDANGPVLISMLSTTGKTVSKEIPCTDHGCKAGGVPFTGEFDVEFDSIQEILKAAGEVETIRFGVNQRKKGGYLRFIETPFKSDTDPGDEYLVVLRWTRAS